MVGGHHSMVVGGFSDGECVSVGAGVGGVGVRVGVGVGVGVV